MPGANLGTRYAIFEAVHGSAPDIAGKGVANPIALLRSAALLLEHIGQREPARRIESSVGKTLQAGCGLTRARLDISDEHRASAHADRCPRP